MQLHHIDGDRSNNDRANLAVLCKDCHASAHTKIAYARNLTPDLIRIYNETWQEIVRLRLQPQSKVDQELELQQEVLLQITLIPHSWKNHYMSLYPGSFMGDSDRKFESIWDKMREEGEHPNTEEEWRNYRSLFDHALTHVMDRLERMLTAYGEVIPINVKLAVLRTNLHLRTCQRAYWIFPQMARTVGYETNFLPGLFRDVIKALASLDRLASEERRSKAKPISP